MLKMVGSGKRNGRPIKLVLLGLSHINLDRLKADQPIKFAGEEVGIDDVEFVIFSGETEQSMARELADLVGPKTDVRRAGQGEG